jgi:hypothetical protein
MGLPALHDDYLFVGPLIVRRLQEKLADTPVDLVERTEQVFEADRRTATVMVLWAGDAFAATEAGRARDGASQMFVQRWLAIYCLNNAGKERSARLQAAGPMLSQLHLALAGWKPEGCPRPLVRANAPMRPDFTPIKALYPLGFEITLNL